MRLESGPANYDRNYYLIFCLVCVGLGGYFLYDYKIGYPNKNKEVARTELTKRGFDSAKIAAALEKNLTKPDFQNAFKHEPVDPAGIRSELGEPTATQREGNELVEFYASEYGLGVVPIVRGVIDTRRVRWEPWYKSEEDIRLQLYCGLIGFAVAAYALYRVYKAAALRAVIDDQGLTYGGQRIPFDNMKRLSDYSSKGWVDLYYQQGPQERRLRIDNQKIRKFDQIVEALCQIKGFEDPRTPPKQAETTQPDQASGASNTDEPQQDKVND